MKIKICAPIILMDTSDAISMVKKAEERGASLIEFRLDYIKKDIDIEEISSITTLPKIATARKREEGGFYRGKENKRINLLLKAADMGFEYVDIESSTLNLVKYVNSLKSKGVKVIVSKHIMKNTPSHEFLRRTLEHQIETGADICKIITTAKNWNDNLTVLNFLSDMKRNSHLICFAMGLFGRPSRILSPLIGGYCTYAVVDRGRETAEGQPLLEDLWRVYQILGVTDLEGE